MNNKYTTLTQAFDAAFDAASRQVSYPPYSIYQMGESLYGIDIAVAGFSWDDLCITKEGQELFVKGKINKPRTDRVFSYRGIGERDFNRKFTLDTSVDVKDAQLHNGILTIVLKRDVPEKPKAIRIEIMK